jgi:hypothetical protein
MDKENIVHPHNGIIFSLKKMKLVICDNIDGTYVQQTSQAQKDKYTQSHVYDKCKKVNFIKVGGRTIVSKGWGE